MEHFIINNVSLLRSPPDEMSLHKQNTSPTLCEDQNIQAFSSVQDYMFTMPEVLKKYLLRTDGETLVWTIRWLYMKICEFSETPQETEYDLHNSQSLIESAHFPQQHQRPLLPAVDFYRARTGNPSPCTCKLSLAVISLSLLCHFTRMMIDG